MQKCLIIKGLNKPEVLRLFSTMFDISEPMLFLFNIFSKLFLEFSSIDKGDTAKGSGFRFPLVISTSIKACAFKGTKTKIKIKIF